MGDARQVFGSGNGCVRGAGIVEDRDSTSPTAPADEKAAAGRVGVPEFGVVDRAVHGSVQQFDDLLALHGIEPSEHGQPAVEVEAHDAVWLHHDEFLHPHDGLIGHLLGGIESRTALLAVRVPEVPAESGRIGSCGPPFPPARLRSVRVCIDQDLCTGDGLCVDHCPDVFVQLDDGIAYVSSAGRLGNDPGGSTSMVLVRPRLENDVVAAALDCPGECIFIEIDPASIEEQT